MSRSSSDVPRECTLQRTIPAIAAVSTGVRASAGEGVHIPKGASILVCGAGFDEHTLRILWEESYYFVYVEYLQMGIQHFLPDEWCEFAFGAISSEQKELMQSHLDKGCGECLSCSALWRDAWEIYQRDTRFSPPPDAVQFARSLFFSRKRWEWLPQVAEFARVVFDSFRQPVPAHARSLARSARRLLHETQSFVVDLQIEDDLALKRVRLTGQIMDLRERGKKTENASVVLFHGGEFAAETTCNASGEFKLEHDLLQHDREAGSMNLFIDTRGYGTIGVRLPD